MRHGMRWRLFAFLLAVSLVTCVLFGLAPALRASRAAPSAAMKTGGHGMTASRGRLGFRGALVVSQVALSLVLLFGALLFTESHHVVLESSRLVVSSTGSEHTGTATSKLFPTATPKKLAGVTPITSTGLSLSISLRPSAGPPPYSCCQKP